MQTQDFASFVILQTKINTIQQQFGINWQTVTWNDLRRPLYSGLAAILYSCVIENGANNTPIPQTMAAQANYWKQFFDSNPGNTPQTFIDRASNIVSQGR